MLSQSTGLRNQLATKVRTLFNWNGATLTYYTGTVPATADAAVSGTALVTFTNNSAVAKVAQKIRFTPVVGGATLASWAITLNGITFTFTDAGTPTLAQITAGLYNLIRAGIGTVSLTTPPGALNMPDVYQKFTLTDNAGTLDVAATTAGIAFDYSSTVTGGGGTPSLTSSIITADAYGLQFDITADISAGILPKLPSQTWSGTAVATGIATYFRLVQGSDDGTLSTSQLRYQGTVGVTGADVNGNTVSIAAGAAYSITGLPITFS